MIEVRELVKRYEPKTAVDGLDFTVRPGVVTGFLGPNGAGKSTTMRVIVGLDAPSSGSATVNGRRYREYRAPLQEVGVLLEARSIHPGRTAYSHLRGLALTHGIASGRVDEVIDLAGLAAVAHQRAGAFSLGMGQRLGIAAALLGDPETIMLDEPANGLLDVMMPDGDGFEVVRRMRSSGPDVPVIFLSARDGVRERIAGLALGGDDYFTKPFSLDEVVERIRAVLRRTGRASAASRLRVAELELDEESHEVRRDGTLIALTPTEFALLRFLMQNAGRVLSRGQILDHVWDRDPASERNVVEPCVSYLRRKVDQGEPRLIHTVRGVGYVLRIPPP
jgi:DNA-binding response OmpR family regulator